MDKAYFIERMQASLSMARQATGSAARLIHLELAGRYGLVAGASPGEVDCPRHAFQGMSSFYAGDARATP